MCFPQLAVGWGKSESALVPVFNKQWVKFEAVILQCVGHLQGRCGASKKSLQAKGADADTIAHAEQEYWVDTMALLLLLSHWSRHRKEWRLRDLAQRCLLAFLRTTLSESCFREIHLPTDVPAGVECEQPAGLSGHCRCWTSYLSQLHATSSTDLLERAVACMTALSSEQMSCRLVCTALSRLCTDLATYVEQRVMQWGDFNWQTGAHAVLAGESQEEATRPTS